jgi:asparagine synthase (glutamine-hydrolysing)
VLYKKKHGFGVPLGHWLLSDPKLSSLCQDVLADSQTVQRGWMKRSYLEQLRNLHRYGHAAYYGDLVWCLVVLELWQRNHFAGRKAVAGVR